MEVKTQCPQCKQIYIVDDSFIGHAVECEKCGTAFSVKTISSKKHTPKTKRIIIVFLSIVSGLFAIVLAIVFCCTYINKIIASNNYVKGLEAKNEGTYGEAIHYFHKAAEKGHKDAQFELGLYYEEEYKKEEFPWDIQEAVKWFEEAALNGHIEAEYKLGKLCQSDIGVKAFFDAAFYFALAASNGHKDAQFELGCCLFYGNGVSPNIDTAETWFERAAEQGNIDAGKYLDAIKTIKSADQDDVQAQYKLGELYLSGNIVKQDKNEAIKWFRKAANRGHKDAQCRLGLCYYHGDGITRDTYDAVKWFRKAAEQNHAKALWNLGCCYILGEGVEEDIVEACKMFLKSSEQGNEEATIFLDSVCSDNKLISDAVQGNAEAQYKIAYELYKKEGISKNSRDLEINSLMFKWLNKAAKQGHRQAQYALGVYYYKEKRIITDESYQWFQKAANQGLMQAQSILGYVYYYGADSYSSRNGISADIDRDRNKALIWLKKAAEQGDETARYNLEVFSNNRSIRKPDIEWNEQKEIGEKVNSAEIEKINASPDKDSEANEHPEGVISKKAETEQKEQEKKRQKENSDEDSDGFTYAQETEAGTNPRDPSSHPKYITQVYISSVSQQCFSGLELVSIEPRGGKGSWEASFSVIRNNRKRSEVVRINDKFNHNNTSFSIIDIEDTNTGHIQNGRFITTYIVYIKRVGRQERIPCRIKEPIYDPVLRVNFINALNNREFSASVGNTFKVGNSKTGEEQYKVISANLNTREAVVESVDKDKKRYNLNAINPKRIEESKTKASSTPGTSIGRVLTDAERARLRAQEMEINRRTAEMMREMDRKMDRERARDLQYQQRLLQRNNY